MKQTITKVSGKVALALFSLGSVTVPAFAQDGMNHCGLHHVLHKLYENNPGIEAEHQQKHQFMLEEGKRNLEAREASRDTTAPSYIIPVVFHIVHDYGAENISDAQVLDQMRILNDDYRKMNSDTSQIVAEFAPLAADCKIEFRLAQIDPDGNCTNGIDRIPSMETYVGDDGSKLNRWPRNKYLNVWVVKTMMNGVAGYAYYPSAVDGILFPYDGVIILQDYIGSIGTSSVSHSRALTHEIGHYLSLAHTWGNTNSPGVACGDDGILDTPATKGWTTCNLTNNAVCTIGDNENVQNYMEYAYCSKMFTYGQRAQMWFALNGTTAERYKLWQPANLAATGCLNTPVVCAPKADFHPNRRLVCEGTTVIVNDESWNGTPTAWNWTVTGPQNFSSTLQNPQFTFNTVGSYDVKLVVSNAQGTDSITKGEAILVSSDYAVLNAQYTESFEDPNVFYLGYVSNNRYGNYSYFQRSESAAYSGTASAMLNDYGNTVRGDIDELITPSYYLSYLSSLQFEFKYAYATAATSADLNTQALKVYTSIDCGQTWILRWTKSGQQLVTGGFTPNSYVPQGPNDWATVTIPLPSNCAAPNVRFKFEFTSPEDETGNNLYIDDININAVGVGINDAATGSAFSIYPNPGDGNSTITYALEKESNVKVELLDVTGRLVREIHSGSQATGQHQLPVSDEPLAVGTYLIRMMIDEKVTTQKYVVTE